MKSRGMRQHGFPRQFENLANAPDAQPSSEALGFNLWLRMPVIPIGQIVDSINNMLDFNNEKCACGYPTKNPMEKKFRSPHRRRPPVQPLLHRQIGLLRQVW